MQARRAEMWKKDPELVKLMDQHDFKTRQHNAAVGQGLTKEAADLKLELSDAGHRNRRPADAASRTTACTPTRSISSSGSRSRRSRTSKRIARPSSSRSSRFSRRLARARPADEKLSPQQQRLAAELEKRLADVGAAGRQYAASTANAVQQGRGRRDPHAAGGGVGPAREDSARKQALTQPPARRRRRRRSSPRRSSPWRRPRLPAPAPAPAANPQAAIEQKQQELAAAEQARAEAEAAYFAANKKLHDLKERIDQARAAGEKRDALVRQRDHRAEEPRPDRQPVRAEEKARGAEDLPCHPDGREP